VILHLNLLHLVLVLGAMASVHLVLREIRRHTMRRWKLFVPPVVAVAVAMILVLFQLAAKQPAWWFGALMAFGLAVGALRGATVPLDVDHTWRLVRPTSRRALLWASLVIPVAVGLEIGGALAGPPGNIWRLVATLAAVLAAGLLAGRALALAFRLWRAPHVDLR
jgi:hypothetical protein